MEERMRIVALDLDGTLLDSEKRLTPGNAEALARAAEEGAEIVPTTGRLYMALPEAVRDLPYIRWVISVNGAQVRDRFTGEVVYRAEIPNGQALEVMAFLDGQPCIYDCYMDDAAWMAAAHKELIDEFAPDRHYRNMLHELRRPVPDLKAFVAEQGGSVQKIQFFVRDLALRARLLEEIPRRFPDLLVTSSVSNNIEINAASANKGAALRKLAEHLGIPMAQVMAAGDGLNDLTMIEAAGVGVAMENACPEAKALANFITGDCDHDGVAQAVRRYCLLDS